MARIALSDWSVENFRLTAFPVAGASERRPEWFEAATGAEPDQVIANPKLGSARAVGTVGAGKLTLRLEPERIDWFLEPPDREEGVPPVDMPSIGDVSATWALFEPMMTKWLGDPSLPDFSRLAFGAVLHHTELDRKAGYERLPDYVPVQVDAESASDFLFQVNIPTISKRPLAGLKLNRLTTWSVAAWRMLAFANGQTSLRPPVFALRVELDVNTAPEPARVLPRHELTALFAELSAEGFRVATNGLNG